MELINFIAKATEDFLNEEWYHGTPDARELEKIGGFSDKKNTVDYISDIEEYNKIQNDIKNARENGDNDLYFKLLDMIPKIKKKFTYPKPIFLTDKYSVAKTYADPERAFDYQNAKEKIIKVDVNCEKIVKISAYGDRFRFISIDKVVDGFVNSGIDRNEMEELISKFNYYIPNRKGIRTDVIAAIGNWLKFDCIDVLGVLDSYHGGSIKSTVRMVLNPQKIKILNEKKHKIK